MKATKKLKLIEGEFSPKDGKEMLFSLYKSKINFHQMKNFSSNERFGKDDQIATKRIPELRESMNEIDTIFQEAITKNKKILVTSVITIELVDHKR